MDMLAPKRRRSSTPRILPAPLEFRIHCMVADSLRRWASKDWEWTHLPFGEKRSAKTGARLKRMGVKPGWADFAFIGPKAALKFLELKRRNEDLTEAQAEFFAAMRARGIECEVARSHKEAIAILGRWGVVPTIKVMA